MRILICFAALHMLANTAAQAQDVKTPADAFKAGADFANSAKGKGAATGAVNSTTGAGTVPKYNTNPKEANVFAGGKALIGGAGTGKVSECKTSVAGNAYDQQECNAVNFLNKTEKNNKFTIDKNKDPLLVNSKATIKNPGTIPTTGQSACQIQKTIVPGTYTTHTCEESPVLATVACNKTLLPECKFEGAAIKQSSTSKVGAFNTIKFVAAQEVGMYDYEISGGGCSTEGTGELSFKLDTVGMGGYVTIKLSILDDAAAIAVNDTTVFAGYPATGPSYQQGTFPSGLKHFKVGYAWSEDVGGERCVQRDLDNNCTKKAWVSDVRTFTASTKLLDYCPSGYAPTSQNAYRFCGVDGAVDEESCFPVSNYTPNNIPGFFCNAEGKFLMNRFEGDGGWSGDVSAIAPLKPGVNKIQAYWGTLAPGCGDVRITGKVFNVAPNCISKHDDKCADARAALQGK